MSEKSAIRGIAVAVEIEPGASETNSDINDQLIFRLKKRSLEFRLPDDTAQRATSERIVKRNGNCYGRCLQMLLHDLMTSTLPDGDKSILLEDATNVCPGENPEFTQPVPRPELQTLRCESGG